MMVLPDRLVRLLRANGSATMQSSDEAEELLSSDGFRGATAQLASQLGRAVADVQAEAAVRHLRTAPRADRRALAVLAMFKKR